MSATESPHEQARRAARGDTAALALLYERYGELVHRTAYRLTGSADDADDVVQDVFIGLPEALRRYDERGRFDQWLGRVVVRLTLMRLRAARRRHAVIESRTVESDQPPFDALERLGTRMSIERALAHLPTNARIVVVLKAAEGYTHADIASLLGISRPAVELRYWRAIRKLRALLEKDR